MRLAAGQGHLASILLAVTEVPAVVGGRSSAVNVRGRRRSPVRAQTLRGERDVGVGDGRPVRHMNSVTVRVARVTVVSPAA